MMKLIYPLKKNNYIREYTLNELSTNSAYFYFAIRNQSIYFL